MAMSRERLEIAARLDAMNLPGPLGLEIRAMHA
jgi:hypothetical protein